MELTQDQVRAFAGPNADYYLERWHRILPDRGSRALGFNWGACLGNYGWLLYRRMYGFFGIAMAVLVGEVVFAIVIVILAILGVIAAPDRREDATGPRILTEG